MPDLRFATRSPARWFGSLILAVVLGTAVPAAAWDPPPLASGDLEALMTSALRGYDGSMVVIDLKTGRECAVGPHVNEPQMPASTFKLISSYYLLSTGKHQPGQVGDCTPFQMGRRRYRCWNRKGHGEIDMVRALAVSCNGFFFANYDYEVILGVVEQALKAGYTLVEGEAPRMAPDILIHGDGLKITPIDQARFITCLAPGQHHPAVKGPPVPLTDPVAIAELRRGMEAAVTDGSGRICRIPGFAVAGKTGSWKGSRWFACYAPIEDPRFVAVAYTRGGSIHGGVEVCRRFFNGFMQAQGLAQAPSPVKRRRHRMRQ